VFGATAKAKAFKLKLIRRLLLQLSFVHKKTCTVECEMVYLEKLCLAGLCPSQGF